MIAEIIPYRRTIRGLDWFDYTILPDMDVSVGSMVQIEFRATKIIGLVRRLKQTTNASKIKPILQLLPPKYAFDNTRMQFLEWLAKHYFISLPHAFKTSEFPPAIQTKHKIKLSYYSPNTPAYPRVVHKQLCSKIQPGAEHLAHYFSRQECLQFYADLISCIQGHVLIIAPEYVDVLEIAATLHNAMPKSNNPVDIIAFTKNPAPTILNALESHLAEKQRRPQVVIGTKKMIFLKTQFFKYLIIDQEDAKSHKQYDSNPRYHTRVVAQKLWQLYNSSGLTLILTSAAPSIDAYYKKNIKIDIRQQKVKNFITMVDMETEKLKQNFSWFSDELQSNIQRAQRSFLFLNRTGDYRIAVCQDCAALLPPTVPNCPQCRGIRIKKIGKGVAQLEKELRLLFPQKKILRIDRSQKKEVTDAHALQQAEIIIGTEKIFRITPLENFDFIGILSVDHLLIYPHWQAHERVFQLLIKLFAAQKKTILQTHAPHHPLLRAAVQNSYENYFKEELKMRQSLLLPPFGYYFQLRHRKTHKIMVQRSPLEAPKIAPEIIVDRYD